MRSQKVATIQARGHFLNPSALRETPSEFCDPDFGGFLRTAHELGLTENSGSLSRIREHALRYVVSLPEITSAIIGFGQVNHVELAARIADEPRLSSDELASLDKLRNSSLYSTRP